MTGYPEIPDVAKRLRAATRITAGWAGKDIIDPLFHEAADEIERLRELLREARAEFTLCDNPACTHCDDRERDFRNRIDAALGREP